MAQVIIRNIDDDVMARLRQRARQAQRPLEQMLRDILTQAARPSRAELKAELKQIRAMSPPLPPGAPTAEELIREDRDSR